MVAVRWPRRVTRFRALVAVAAALAVVAGVTNYTFWRRRAANPPPAAVAAGPSAQVGAERARERNREALRALARTVEARPQDIRARFALAEASYRAGDYSGSLAELQHVERRHPRNPEVYLRQAVVRKAAGKLPEAERAARRALALDPGLTVAREWLAQFCMDTGRSREALELYEQSLSRRPNSYLSLVGKGRALEELFRHQHPIAIPDMVRPIEKAVALQPENPLALLILARMRFSYLKQPEAAEELALRAAQRDPSSEGPYILLGEIALSRPPSPETLQRAGEYIYEAGRRNLKDPRPPYQFGRLCLLRNDIPRAVKSLEHSLTLGALPETVSQLSMAHRRAGNAERADYYGEIYQVHLDRMERRDSLLRALTRDRRNPNHYLDLAKLYLEAGEPDTAERWLEPAARLGRREAETGRLLARAQAMRKKGNDPSLLPLR